MEIEVERIRALISELLEPALSERCKVMERALTSTLVNFQEDVRSEVRRDHAENRTRLQDNYDMSSKAFAESQATNSSTTRIEERVDGLYTLFGEIKGLLGKNDGERLAEHRFKENAHADDVIREKKRDRRLKIVQWIFGLGSVLTALFSWIEKHWKVGLPWL